MIGRKYPVKWNKEKVRWDDPPTVDCSEDFKAGRMAVQADADAVDINKLIQRAQNGGTMPQASRQGFYGDVSDFGGLQEAFIKVQEAQELFLQYPADLRERFDNDPVRLVEFLEDPGNLDEAVKLGLVEKRVPETPTPPAPPVPEPAVKPV